MKLQLALDDITLTAALTLVDKVREYIDIIEVGTPFLYEEGLAAVRELRKRFPEKEVLADMKIMDAGEYETRQALKAGADYVTVLGVTDILTVKGCLAVAAAIGKTIVADNDLRTRPRLAHQAARSGWRARAGGAYRRRPAGRGTNPAR